MINIILFGPPGSGKGTQSRIISNIFGFIHLSTGEIFREYIIQKNRIGDKIKSYIDNGLLVPDSITTNIFEKELLYKNNLLNKGFIYDGYPRTLNQAIKLDNFLKNKYIGNINYVFFFKLKDNIIIDRIYKRSKISGRSDDKNINIIKNRIIQYNKMSLNIFKYYKERGCLIEIDANKKIEEITQELKNLINKL